MKTRQWRPAPPERTVREAIALRAKRLALLAALVAAFPAHAVVITFDGVPTVTPGPIFGNLDETLTYHEGGYVFTTQGSQQTHFARWNFNGASASSCSGIGPGCSFTIAREDGGDFILNAFDVMTTNFDWCSFGATHGEPSHIGVLGVQLTACGVFQHFAFGEPETTLLSVTTAAGNALQLDNLELVSGAPEPETWALLLLGLTAIARRRFV